MFSQLKIYVDRLNNGHVEKIEDSISSDILDIQEENLAFKGLVSLVGEASVVDEHLILKLKVQALALLPCSVCNLTLELPITLDQFYFTKPIDEISSAIFDFTDEVRNAILLHVPLFAECANGRCPERVTVSKYLKKSEGEMKKPEAAQIHYPFADL